ncbi:Protein of unknown function [Bacillus mycoides]|nr:Protein of unknown function [Bacillus mycoides]
MIGPIVKAEEIFKVLFFIFGIPFLIGLGTGWLVWD